MPWVTGGGEVLLPAAEPERLAEWYLSHLGIEPACGDTEWSAYEHPHQARPSFRLQPSTSTHPGASWSINFTVSDLAGILSRLREAGIEIDDTDVAAGRPYARLRDLESNTVTLWQAANSVHRASSTDEFAVRAIDDPQEGGSSAAGKSLPQNWRIWTPLIVVVVALVATLVLVDPWQESGEEPGNPQANPTELRQGTSVRQRAVRTTTGHPLLGISAEWELFAWGRGNLVHLDFSRGSVTRTRVPSESASGGPVNLVVGPNRALVQGTALSGYTIPDGRPAEALKLLEGEHEPIFPGPEAGQVWALERSDTNPRLVLFGPDGHATGQVIEYPADGFRSLVRDYRGNVLFDGIGGVYLGTVHGLRKVAKGTLLAVGPTRLLTLRCDEQARCSDVVINRTTGAAHVLEKTPLTRARPVGVISPDGSTVAIVRPANSYRSSLQVIDLATGEVRAIAPMRSPYYGGNTAWSPDGQWLFAASRGLLLAFDTRTYRIRRFDLELPPVSHVAIRPDDPSTR